jgi:hypothetical protein
MKKNNTIITSLIIIALVISIIMFLWGKYNWGINNSAELGSLLSGTFGVIASVGAMIAVISTLREQQKVNNQKDIIDAFTHELNRLNSLMDNDEFDKLWENNISPNLDKITYDLSNETIKNIENLKEFCTNEKLKKLSTSLNHMLSIKEKAINLNSEVGQMIKLEWDIIPEKLKQCVGFYLSWNTADITIAVAKRNEFIKSYVKRDEFILRLSRYIPMFCITDHESLKGFEELEQHSITIKSKCVSIIRITNIDLYFNDGRPVLIPIELTSNIMLQPKESIELKLNEIFGNEIVKQIKEKMTISSPLIIYIDIHTNFHDNDKYIYKGQLEFNSYPNFPLNKNTGMKTI